MARLFLKFNRQASAAMQYKPVLKGIKHTQKGKKREEKREQTCEQVNCVVENLSPLV